MEAISQDKFIHLEYRLKLANGEFIRGSSRRAGVPGFCGGLRGGPAGAGTAALGPVPRAGDGGIRGALPGGLWRL